MHQSSTAAVRLLAAWQQQRRELSDRLDGLLLHGPTAVDRVAARADELRTALEDERLAFEVFVAEAGGAPGAAPPPAAHLTTGRSAVDGLVEPYDYPPLRSVHDPAR